MNRIFLSSSWLVVGLWLMPVVQAEDTVEVIVRLPAATLRQYRPRVRTWYHCDAQQLDEAACWQVAANEALKLAIPVITRFHETAESLGATVEVRFHDQE